MREGASFSVSNVRLARRIGGQGEFRTEMVAEVVQTLPTRAGLSGPVPYRGGATLVIDLRSWQIRYVIHKRLYQELPPTPKGSGVPAGRLQRQHIAATRAEQSLWEDSGDLARALRATYAGSAQGVPDEPFALLHRSLD